jgi:hypothetical protein
VIVVSQGPTKSGTTLAFEITRAVLESNGCPQRALPDGVVTAGHQINFVHRWNDDALLALVEETRGERIVVKTHGPPDLACELVDRLVASGDLRIHVVVRDPRDQVLSMLDAGRAARAEGSASFSQIETIDDALFQVHRQLAWVRAWGSRASLRLVYDRFAFDRTIGPQMIAADLGLVPHVEAVWRTLDDRFTQKNVARPERYRTEMEPAVAARIVAEFPDLIGRVIEERDLSWFDEAQFLNDQPPLP